MDLQPYASVSGLCPHLQSERACPLCIRDKEIARLNGILKDVKAIAIAMTPNCAVESIKRALENQ